MKHIPTIAGALLGLAFVIFIAGGGAVFQPPVIAVAVLSAYLLWTERGKFLGLVR